MGARVNSKSTSELSRCSYSHRSALMNLGGSGKPCKQGNVIDNLDSPGYRISSDGERSPVADPLHRRTKLVGFPWFNLVFSERFGI